MVIKERGKRRKSTRKIGGKTYHLLKDGYGRPIKLDDYKANMNCSLFREYGYRCRKIRSKAKPYWVYIYTDRKISGTLTKRGR